MKQESILLIANPAAGKENPILELMGRVFAECGPEFSVHVLEKAKRRLQSSEKAMPRS
jgi:diacylglycerol kinase family enzyme